MQMKRVNREQQVGFPGRGAGFGGGVGATSLKLK